MREIKFRGKRKDKGGWEYGDLITKPVHHECVILENGVINHSVDPATVGQFTGLKDKNGKEIYEGDIIQYAEKYFYIVKYEDAKFVGYHANNDWGKWGDLYKLGTLGFDKYNYIVIGNIYENPDLITKN